MSALHAGAVLLPHGAVLLTGAAGSGKSSLLARLIDGHEGRLIADDRVEISAGNNRLIAAAPSGLAGLLEVRGLGIIQKPIAPASALCLAIDLVARSDVPRVAEADYFDMHGVKIPRLKLHAFDMATPLIICEALMHLPRSGFQKTGQYTDQHTDQ